jgi:3alpha(or 20beta)-hydroxysteroid dehydrogenase
MATLDGQVVLVTGAARGIGAATVHACVAEGARVVATDLLIEPGLALADELGDSVVFMELDVSNEEAWSEVVDRCTRTVGPINVLINNAAILAIKPIIATSLDEYSRVIAVNQIGPFLGMRAVLPAMVAASGGAIVNISSTDANNGAAGLAAYCGSKAALIAMTKVAALEHASDGIRVNAVVPGPIDTPMVDLPELAGLSSDLRATMAKRIPLKCWGRPEDVANAIVWLASGRSSFCTGSAIVLDGGLTLGLHL